MFSDNQKLGFGLRSGCNNSMFGKHHTDASKRKMSETRQVRFKNGNIIPWNKGLTKDTDERVKANALASGATLKGKYCGEKNPNYGRQHTDEERKKISDKLKEKVEKGWVSPKKGKTFEEQFGKEKALLLSKKLSESHKGQISHWKGKHFSDDCRKKISEGTRKAMNTPEMLEKMKEARKKRFLTMSKWGRPTRYEKQIIEVCQEFNFPFEYVGNGKFLVGGKNPDFVNRERKKIIEVYRAYWKEKNYEEIRSKLFAEQGYATLFLKDEDVNVAGWKSVCCGKINSFLGGGVENAN